MYDLSLEQFENGVSVYQDESLYKFTSDSIKLAKFCKFKPGDNVLDMCAGCGVVGFYAYSINPCNKIYFNDIQPQMCDLIKKNIELNSLQDTAKAICKDLKELSLSDFGKGLDVITCNPPYFKLNGKIKQDKNKAICRHEIATNLQTIIEVAGRLIKSKGRFYLVVPSDRLCECITLLVQNKLEVKNIEMYHSNLDATVCLIKSVKDDKSGVNIKILKEGL
jgi:tRNA1(Val) A37 N6-methylase TrmN6